jgi:surface protein
MFQEASSFVGGNLSQWDTSNVETMSFIFNRCKLFNGDISQWEFNSAFAYCERFDGDVSAWNTSNVRIMYRMFKEAWLFSSDVSNWNTRKVTFTSEMVGPI